MLRKMTLCVTLLSIVFALASTALALDIDSHNLGLSAQYLKLGLDARSAGMGNAYTAIVNDGTSVYYNPAGLGFANGKDLSVMHSELWMDATYDAASLSIPKTLFGFNLGLSAFMIKSPNFIKTDELGNVVGAFDCSATTYMFGLGKSAKIGQTEMAIGASVKCIEEKIDDQVGKGYGFDLGVIAKLENEKLILACDVQNVINTKVEWSNGTVDSTGRNIILGLALKPAPQFTVAASYNRLYNTINLGAEYKIGGWIDVRAGLNNSRLTLGAGLNIKNLRFDYAMVTNDDLGNTQRLSANLKF